jgi:hypothetical protein
MRKLWKDYKIVYISSLDIKAWFTSLPGKNQTILESVLGKQRATVTGHFLKHAQILNHGAKCHQIWTETTTRILLQLLYTTQSMKTIIALLNLHISEIYPEINEL